MRMRGRFRLGPSSLKSRKEAGAVMTAAGFWKKEDREDQTGRNRSGRMNRKKGGIGDHGE